MGTRVYRQTDHRWADIHTDKHHARSSETKESQKRLRVKETVVVLDTPKETDTDTRQRAETDKHMGRGRVKDRAEVVYWRC